MNIFQRKNLNYQTLTLIPVTLLTILQKRHTHPPKDFYIIYSTYNKMTTALRIISEYPDP